ncbi:putative MFS monocarboxylate transporter [Phaeosphaeriaceae sp. PMI808]|nr:putative MFS monocarboxylate transporter [Phaeosphaeriaceae sp. PMI808]
MAEETRASSSEKETKENVNAEIQTNFDVATATTRAPLAPPDGGTKAWLAVVAACLSFLIAWGPSTGFGAFQEYYIDQLFSDYSAFAISWIGTVNAFFLISTGVLAGPLFDRGYLIHLMALGHFMVVFGMMMLSLADKFYQVLLAFGFCVGIGSGLLYVPAIALVNTTFSTKRALAMGIVTCGASIGGVIFPIVFIRLQPSIGYPWTIRVLAFLQFGCSCIAMPILLCVPRPPRPTTPRRIIHWQAMKEGTFSAYCVANFLIFMAYFVPLFYVPYFASNILKTNKNLGFYVLAALNGASAVGRLGSAIVAQKLGAPNILLFSVVASGILIFGWTGVNDLGGFVTFAVLFGLFSGILISSNPVVIAHPVISPTPDVIGTRLGMQWFATSLGVLIGAPIAGAIGAAETRKAFVNLAIYSGAVMVTGCAALLVPLRAIWKHNKTKVY